MKKRKNDYSHVAVEGANLRLKHVWKNIYAVRKHMINYIVYANSESNSHLNVNTDDR